MEITEKERMLLVKKKEEICGATFQILDMAHEPKNAVEIKKDITLILSLLSTISSYSKSGNLDFASLEAEDIFEDMRNGADWHELIVPSLERFCNDVNSIRFDFTEKRGLKVVLPKNLNFGNITNK